MPIAATDGRTMFVICSIGCDVIPDDSSQYGRGRSNWARRQPADGSFEVAGTGTWMARRGLQANPQIERNFRATMRGMFGDAYSDPDLEILQDRALEAVRIGELPPLTALQAGSPVYLTPVQKGVVDRLVSELGDDELGRRAKSSYGEALRDGRIRVRK